MLIRSGVGRSGPEGGILAKEVVASFFEIQVEVLVPDVMAGVVDRLKRRPRAVGKPGDHFKGGILPEQLRAVEFLELQAEVLMAQIMARVIHRLKRDVMAASKPRNDSEGRVFSVQII